ncbi:MAG: hypothetical protein ACR2QV_05465 [Gammaproteobacteria bacterium]
MARRSPQTQAKRERELMKARKRQEKIARREQRKALKEQGGVDPNAESAAEAGEAEEPGTDDAGVAQAEPKPGQPPQ